MYKAACLILTLIAVANAIPSAYDTEHVWKTGNLSYIVPQNTILSGYNPKGFYTYVGRVKHSTGIFPARVVVETGVADYNTDSAFFQHRDYDYLLAEGNVRYVWVRSFDGFYEKGAVAVGINNQNERVYCCRIHADGGLLMGFLLLSKKICMVKHENLYHYGTYEVLVAQRLNETIY